MEYNYPYLLLVTIYILLFVIERVKSSNQKVLTSIRVVSAVVFFVFFGFRGYVGTDWINYEISYTLTSWESWTIVDYEPGFSALAKTFKYLGFNYFIFVALITGLQVWLFDKFISRYSPSISLCYIIIIALFPIAIIDLQRNLLSILIVINGLHFLENNRKIKYYQFVILGMLFHLSSIVFFVLPFIRKTVIKRTVLIVLFFVGLIVYFLQINFYNDILLFIGSVFGGGIENLIEQAAGDSETAYGVSIGIIEKILLFILLLIHHQKIKYLSPLIVNACFIYLFIYLYFSTSQSFISRFAILFFWGYMLIYCYFSILLFKRYRYFFIMMLLFFSLIRTYLGYRNILYEYKNILFQDEDRYIRRVNRDYYYKNR